MRLFHDEIRVSNFTRSSKDYDSELSFVDDADHAVSNFTRSSKDCDIQ